MYKFELVAESKSLQVELATERIHLSTYSVLGSMVLAEFDSKPYALNSKP